jgi:1-acyl-sn-glycerol-3-phosphate acyltransferase
MSGTQFGLLQQRRFLPFFLTQALGAFNDNVFKQALITLIAFRIAGLSQDERSLWANVAAALFILPFFLFSANAGQWAEKFEKSRSIRRIKALEVAIMALATVAFWLDSLPFLLFVLFLLGVQATLFGPLKYAILPQALRPEELVGGNALVEAATFLTILGGTLIGSWLINGYAQGPAYVSALILLCAALGWWSSTRIPPAPAAAPGLVLNWNPVSQTARTLGQLRGHPAVLNSVLGVSWFWFFGAMVLAQLPVYAKVYLGGDGTVFSCCLALFSVGIGAGSLLCELLSRRTVEIGLVPLGALGLTVFGVDLYFAQPEASGAAGLGWLEFLRAPGNWRIALDLTLIGVFGGFYIVPLFALIQQRAPREKLSRIIAANNIVNALFMVAAALLAILLLRAGLSVPELFLYTALLNAAVAVYIFALVPEFVTRFVAWLVIKALYRVEIRGVEQHVPDEGAALVVCNHVSFMDALLLAGAVPRPIRFVMYYKIYHVPVLNLAFRAARAIPIAGAREDEALMQRAFAEIDAALANGELVGIFPEGGLTRDGEIAKFRPGVERVLATRPVPVVPLALRGMWASMWSRRNAVPGNSWLDRMRLPRRIRARIEIVADAPVPRTQASAAALEAKVRELRGDRA